MDRGTASGVQRGMAVVTPDGIVGKVIAAYPTASEVLLITDSDFAAGVISQKTPGARHAQRPGNSALQGGLRAVRGEGGAGRMVLHFRRRPRSFRDGFPVGMVKAVRPGQPFKEILVEPSGMQHGLEDVLISSRACIRRFRRRLPSNQPVYHRAAAAGCNCAGDGAAADRLRGHRGRQAAVASIKSVGDAQNHTFGEGGPGSKPPDFTKLPAGPRSRGRGPGGAGNNSGAEVPGEPRPPNVSRTQGANPGRQRRVRSSRPKSRGHRADLRRGAATRPRALLKDPRLMSYSDGRMLLSSQREGQVSRFRAWVMVAGAAGGHPVPGLRPAVSFRFSSFLEMPLLVVVYFALMRRSQIGGCWWARPSGWRRIRCRRILWACSAS